MQPTSTTVPMMLEFSSDELALGRQPHPDPPLTPIWVHATVQLSRIVGGLLQALVSGLLCGWTLRMARGSGFWAVSGRTLSLRMWAFLVVLTRELALVCEAHFSLPPTPPPN